MQAVRENRYIVLPKDFEKGYKNNIKKDENEHEFYQWIKKYNPVQWSILHKNYNIYIVNARIKQILVNSMNSISV